MSELVRLWFVVLIALGLSTPVEAQNLVERRAPLSEKPASTSDLAIVRKEVEAQIDKTDRETRAELRDIKKDLLLLDKKLDYVFWAAGAVIALLGIGAVFSIIVGYRIEKRDTEKHDWARDARSATEVQATIGADREKSMFTASSETLNLVNKTLQLAYNASERAANAFEHSLDNIHETLKKECESLLDEADVYNHYKILTRNASYTADVRNLAQEIALLEGHQRLINSKFQLSPACCFVRGMNFHIEQSFKKAFEYWERTAIHAECRPPLKMLALLWCGYERNNLGQYDKAVAKFEEAVPFASGFMRYELERLRIEGRFFDKERYATKDVLAEIEALSKRISHETDSPELREEKGAITSTRGNVLLELGKELKASGTEAAAKKCFQDAKETFGGAPIKTLWTWAGYSDACWYLGEAEESAQIARDYVLHPASEEYNSRPEARTRVLAQTTVAICHLRIPELKAQTASILGSIRKDVGDVLDEITIYSPLQKRNVTKKQFYKELDSLYDELGVAAAGKRKETRKWSA